MSTFENPPAGGSRDQGADERHLSAIVALIQELTSRGIRSESVAALVERAFETLSRCLPFDVGVAVMIEQHLELYISTSESALPLVDDRVIAHVLQTLEELIPLSFETSDLIVKGEWHRLPEVEATGEVERGQAHAVLEIDGRVAGVVVLDRAGAFTTGERYVFEIFAAQLSLLLDNLGARERILNLADSDDLTGIWNKRYFRRQLPHEVERARVYGVPLSLLIFDVDDFKQINDRYGHTTGDVVLSELCGAVRETLRPPDFFARFGGDEFAVVLPHTDLSGACSVAERILARVAKLAVPVDDELPLRCSISMGVASFGPGDQAADLVRRADELLYAAKRSGKNRFVAATEAGNLPR